MATIQTNGTRVQITDARQAAKLLRRNVSLSPHDAKRIVMALGYVPLEGDFVGTRRWTTGKLRRYLTATYQHRGVL